MRAAFAAEVLLIEGETAGRTPDLGCYSAICLDPHVGATRERRIRSVYDLARALDTYLVSIHITFIGLHR